MASFSFFHLQAAEPGVKGGSATGGSATGGSATGGSATGGSATGGSVTGGSVTGGSATGGSATSTSVTTGTSTPGTSTPGTATPGTATATSGGREIRVTAPGSVSVNANGADAHVSLGQQTLIVGRTKLTLDGKDLGEIPAHTKKIEIVQDQGLLSIKGDGKELIRAKVEEPKK